MASSTPPVLLVRRMKPPYTSIVWPESRRRGPVAVAAVRRNFGKYAESRVTASSTSNYELLVAFYRPFHGAACAAISNTIKNNRRLSCSSMSVPAAP